MALPFLYMAFVPLVQILRLRRRERDELAIEAVMVAECAPLGVSTARLRIIDPDPAQLRRSGVLGSGAYEYRLVARTCRMSFSAPTGWTTNGETNRRAAPRVEPITGSIPTSPKNRIRTDTSLAGNNDVRWHPGQPSSSSKRRQRSASVCIWERKPLTRADVASSWSTSADRSATASSRMARWCLRAASVDSSRWAR